MIRLFVAGNSVVQMSSPSPLCIQYNNASFLLKNRLIFFSTSMVKDLIFLSGFGGFPDSTSALSFYVTPQKMKLTREIIRINIFLQNACTPYFLWITSGFSSEWLGLQYMSKHLQVRLYEHNHIAKHLQLKARGNSLNYGIGSTGEQEGRGRVDKTPNLCAALFAWRKDNNKMRIRMKNDCLIQLISIAELQLIYNQKKYNSDHLSRDF